MTMNIKKTIHSIGNTSYGVALIKRRDTLAETIINTIKIDGNDNADKPSWCHLFELLSSCCDRLDMPRRQDGHIDIVIGSTKYIIDHWDGLWVIVAIERNAPACKSIRRVMRRLLNACGPYDVERLVELCS